MGSRSDLLHRITFHGKECEQIHLSHLEGVLIFAGFFAILISAYGLNAGLPDVQSATNTILGPWPSPSFPVLKNCDSTDVLCIINVANAAAAYPGIAIFYLGNVLISALNRVNAIGAIFQIILFGGAFQAGGVPLLGFVMAILILSGLIEVFRIVRGSSSGT
jgi:hypothetical protein